MNEQDLSSKYSRLDTVRGGFRAARWTQTSHYGETASFSLCVLSRLITVCIEDLFARNCDKREHVNRSNRLSKFEFDPGLKKLKFPY